MFFWELVAANQTPEPIPTWMQCHTFVPKKYECNREITAVFQIVIPFFLCFSEKKKVKYYLQILLAHEIITRTQKHYLHINSSSKRYITVQQNRQTTSEKTHNVNLVIIQTLLSLHEHFSHLFYDLFQTIRIERMHVYANFYALWRSLSWNSKKKTQVLILTLLILSFLTYQPLRLTLSIFLASLFTANYSSYHLPHFPWKDLSKLLDVTQW